MISVCIATYNGAVYIERQLLSILGQLDQADEIVLVDDASTDLTLSVVEQLGDTRIQINRNEANLGVIASFEKAIRLARGDLLFLSDQDDLWHQDKVASFIDAFEKAPEAILVLSDARIIDGEDKVLADSFFEKRGAFRPGVWANIIKNKYLGCTMAFRSSLKDKILPIPPEIPMHDMWIGIVSACYEKPIFLESPLIDYRRHSANVSPDRPQGILKMLVWRWGLSINLCRRVIALALRSSRS